MSRLWIEVELPEYFRTELTHVVVDGNWELKVLRTRPGTATGPELDASEHYGRPAWFVGPLRPKLASRLPRWEYRVVGLASTTPSTSEAQAMLNQMGQAGWQLVHGTPGALFFKRRLIP